MYGFACDGVALTRWIVFGLALALDSACFAITLIKKFDQPKYRPFRGIMFMVAGLATLVFFVMLGINPSPHKFTLNCTWYAIGGAVYIAGACNYILRMPERCRPGTFDFCGASH